MQVALKEYRPSPHKTQENNTALQNITSQQNTANLCITQYPMAIVQLMISYLYTGVMEKPEPEQEIMDTEYADESRSVFGSDNQKDSDYIEDTKDDNEGIESSEDDNDEFDDDKTPSDIDDHDVNKNGKGQKKEQQNIIIKPQIGPMGCQKVLKTDKGNLAKTTSGNKTVLQKEITKVIKTEIDLDETNEIKREIDTDSDTDNDTDTEDNSMSEEDEKDEETLLLEKKLANFQKEHSCWICNKGFNSYTDMVDHFYDTKWNLVDPDFKPQVPGQQKIHICPTCGKVVRDQPSLRRHIRMHTGETVATCPQCNKSFKTEGYLKKHMKVHQEGN